MKRNDTIKHTTTTDIPSGGISKGSVTDHESVNLSIDGGALRLHFAVIFLVQCLVLHRGHIDGDMPFGAFQHHHQGGYDASQSLSKAPGSQSLLLPQIVLCCDPPRRKHRIVHFLLPCVERAFQDITFHFFSVKTVHKGSFDSITVESDSKSVRRSSRNQS